MLPDLLFRQIKRPAGSLDPTGPFEPRQRPTFPLPHSSSSIGPGELNFRVRYGNGWNLSGKATGNSWRFAQCRVMNVELRVVELQRTQNFPLSILHSRVSRADHVYQEQMY